MNTQYLRREEAAQYLKDRVGVYTAATLAKLATVGGGPEYRKVGRFPLYTAEALDNWLASKIGPVLSNTAGAR